MATITKPFTFSNGATIVAAEHNSNFDTVYNEFNGNIENANIKANAGIVDTKLDAITTANKVSATALANLSSLPSGAGYLPLANIAGVVLTGANSTITSITGLTTPLALNQGGTAQTTANAALNALLPVQTGNATKFLQTNGTNTSWGTTGGANVVFCWIGTDSATNNLVTRIEGTDLSPNISASGPVNYDFMGVYGATYRPIKEGRFTKISAISTITIHAKLWENSGGGGAGNLKVDIGGQNAIVSRMNAVPGWATTNTIDVSGLDNGTTSNITVTIAHDTATGSVYCSAIMLIAS